MVGIMDKKTWKVDVSHFIEVIADRMYSDPIRAGIRELISNSLDARLKGSPVEIFIEYQNNSLRYIDNGLGIDPRTFKDVYGKIASGHERKTKSRGIFGIGRMSLIASSENGILVSYFKNKKYIWKFDRSGWEGPISEIDKDNIGHGVFLQFNGLKLENLDEIKNWIRKTFSIPLLKKECEITFEYDPLYCFIQDDYLEEDPINTKHGKIEIYIKEEMDGILYICQKGILVREEPFTGLTAYIDQDFLDIKTDREGFVNNEKYRYFKKILKTELAKLRPQKSFEKMEIDFVRRLMKEFKKYWTKKVTKANHIQENLEIQFPKEGEEVLPKEQPIPEIPELSPEVEVPEVSIETPKTTEFNIEIQKSEDDLMVEEAIKEIAKLTETPETVETTKDEKIEEEKIKEEPEQKTVVIRGAKPVDMGEDYPIIFFEKEPFVLLFNTSHPIFKQLVEKGKLRSQELAVLFERMFECAYSDKNPSESLDSLKQRWKEVDLKLKSLFQ